MTYPIPNYTRIKVRGRFVDLAKAARGESSYGLTGSIQFIPTAEVAINQDSDQIIDMTPFTVFPDPVDGYFEVLLPSTDDPDVVPTGWNYRVVEPTGRDYYIVVPHDTPNVTDQADPDFGTPVIELSNVVPNPDANPGTIQLLAGPAGRGIATMTVDAQSHLSGTYTDGVTWDAGLLPVASVAGRTGHIVLTKADVDLANVDNTSDANKPVSTAQQTAINSAVSTHTAAADPHPQYLTSAEGNAAYAALSHAHSASDINAGTLAAARLPNVLSQTRTASGTAITLDAAVSGTLVNVTATADTAFAVPTNPADRQVLRLAVLASGATRNVSFNASVRLSTGLSSRSFAVPSGQVLLAALEYSSLISAWVLTAATISAS